MSSDIVADFCQHSLDKPEDFWRDQAKLIDWHGPFDQVFDGENPPFSRYYVGGQTNLCYNAVDRHANSRPNDAALIYVSSETSTERTYSFSELQAEVEKTAALMLSLGVKKGDRVLLYLPMIPEAVFAMLASVRIGAVHSVVFGGFASQALADRVDDLKPTVIIGADAGLRGGRVFDYKTLLDEALEISSHRPEHALIINRGALSEMPWTEGRDIDYHAAISELKTSQAPIVWLESSEPSYVLYTSGTTGKPKGVQRDTGGHAVAMTASMHHVYDGRPGEAMFATSDIGWVVGHSYIVYGPLLAGMATILYEGTPVHPDPGVWWRLIEKYKPSVMFTSPTAMRLLKKYDTKHITDYDLSSLRRFFIAGEPLDEATAKWTSDVLGKNVYDHCWQTETGWPIISAMPGIEEHPLKWGSPSFPVYGYDIRIIDEDTGAVQPRGQKGMLAIRWPLPPGSMTTIWRDDARFKKTYFRKFGNDLYYLTFDFAIQDEDGYVYLLGRSDDVINVAGHRLGTREIEEAICSHDDVAEAAVVGIADNLKGQTPCAFLVFKNAQADNVTPADLMRIVDQQLGAIARPSRFYVIEGLPKTRSGKVLRRALQALAEGRDPGPLPTIEDMSIMDKIREAIAAKVPQ